MNRLERLLGEKEIVVADGATGTNLLAMGLSDDAAGERWCVDHPDRVRTLHQSFVDAGADIVLTNSFGSNRFRLALHGIEHRVAELNQAAAQIAREVADRAGRAIVVAGSMGPTGELMEPQGTRPLDEVREAFQVQAHALATGGADVAWIETMYCEQELAAAIQAADAVGLPFVATMTFDSGGRTMLGLTPEQAVWNIKQHGSRPLAFGANCGMGPAQLVDTITGLKRGGEAGDVLVAKANAGLPKMGVGMRVQYEGTPEIMAEYACLARDVGARIIGGCCGTTAVHLRAMVDALATRPRETSPDHEKIERILGAVRMITEGRPRRPRRR